MHFPYRYYFLIVPYKGLLYERGRGGGGRTLVQLLYLLASGGGGGTLGKAT
jgi:hypothetical protein